MAKTYKPVENSSMERERQMQKGVALWERIFEIAEIGQHKAASAEYPVTFKVNGKTYILQKQATRQSSPEVPDAIISNGSSRIILSPRGAIFTDDFMDVQRADTTAYSELIDLISSDLDDAERDSKKSVDAKKADIREKLKGFLII